MEVTAWKSDTTSPTARLTTRTGPASSAMSTSACDARWRTVVSSMGSVVEGTEQRVDDERPAVDQDEEQDLEGEGDQRGREHVHAHRHHDRRDHQVDDHERDEDHEPDEEGGLYLREHERRDDGGKRRGR